MTCFDEQDILPYNPDEKFNPEIARLKRIIALRDAELACYRELVPGLKYYPKSKILMDPEHVMYEE